MPRLTAITLALATLSATVAISSAQNASQAGPGNPSYSQSSVPNGYVSASEAYPQNSAPAGRQNEAQIAAQNYNGPSTGPADGGQGYVDQNNGNQAYAQPQQNQAPVQQPTYPYGQQQQAYRYGAQVQGAPIVDSGIQYPPAAVAVAPYPYPYPYYYGYPYYPYGGVRFGYYGGYRGYSPYRGYVGGFRGGYAGGGVRGGYAGGARGGRR